MTNVGRTFRDRLRTRDLAGCAIVAAGNDHYSVDCAEAHGEVNIYPMGDEPEIVEMRLERSSDGEPVFFLHFALEDEGRASALLDEMGEALRELREHQVTRILLCCTSGITTTFFANKLNEAASALSLGYEFSALPFESAVRKGDDFAAVLLAPQVGHLRGRAMAELPGTTVIELPGRVFGAYDAAGALRIVMDALSARPEPNVEARGIPRDLVNDRLVLVISVVYGRLESRILYRVYDHGAIAHEGMVSKRELDLHDIGDVAAAVRVAGWRTEDFDAIGVAVPGDVYHWKQRALSVESATHDLGGILREAFGERLHIENNANAAAVGCLVTQDRFRSLTFHSQPTGHAIGAQGTVLDGHLVRGHHGLAGEMLFARGGVATDEDAPWSADGMTRIVAESLLGTFSAVAPEAFFVASELAADMDALRERLGTVIPPEDMPELVAVDDYQERVALGEYALCLQAIGHRQR